jgi:hypothetical protein
MQGLFSTLRSAAGRGPAPKPGLPTIVIDLDETILHRWVTRGTQRGAVQPHVVFHGFIAWMLHGETRQGATVC